MRAQTYIHISDLVIKSTKTLDERLVDLLTNNGGRDLKLNGLQIFDIHNSNGFSGYNYWLDNTLVGQLQIATLTSGNYAIYKRVYLEGEINEIYDYYDQDGNFSYSSSSLDCAVVMYNSINMEPLNPFINHLYNILYNEYEKATQGNSLTERIILLEKLLNKYYHDEKIELSINKGASDNAVKNIENEIYRIESDPVLRWTERQNIFKTLKDVRKKIVKTKKRVHNLNSFKYNYPIVANDLIIKVNRIRKRPFNNIRGMIYKWTLGKLFWFFSTVKENLGYSIALAIYGPFTFFFITQPLNPSAMWAVGKIRGAYLHVAQTIESTFQEANTIESPILKNAPGLAQSMTPNSASQSMKSDKVEMTQSSIMRKPFEKLPVMKKKDWNDRMSDFKQMQIAYDSNLIFAARMGRLEQMEAQYNFPLTAESLWHETERYIRKIKGDLSFYKNLDPRYKSFLEKELKRTEYVQVYIWKKMAQFFLDHPYIVVDEQKEQKEKDYYTGRAFVFMDKLTKALANKDLSETPHTHKNVKALAKFYKESKVRTGSVIANLQKNSKLFAQDNLFDTEKLRSYMKYHWEVLFLQQNKKQEAASFSLQTYDFSIRNALWTLQSIYSAKREDINTMTYKFNLDNTATVNMGAKQEVNELLESMMHMLTMEYVSIKEEFSKNLKDDEEAILRESLINNEKDYLSERDALYNSQTQVHRDTNNGKRQI